MSDYMTGPWNKGLIQHLYKRFTSKDKIQNKNCFQHSYSDRAGLRHSSYLIVTYISISFHQRPCIKKNSRKVSHDV